MQKEIIYIRIYIPSHAHTIYLSWSTLLQPNVHELYSKGIGNDIMLRNIIHSAKMLKIRSPHSKI